MADHYGDESQSDQEELVGGTDLDDDLTDLDEMQFNFCKPITNENNKLTDLEANATNNGQHTSQQQYANAQMHQFDEYVSKWRLFGGLVALFLTTFALLIAFPFYLEQMSVEGKKNTAYGAILYVTTVVTVILIVVSGLASILFKWDVKIYRIPIPWKQ